jgi:hypothetical protein
VEQASNGSPYHVFFGCFFNDGFVVDYIYVGELLLFFVDQYLGKATSSKVAVVRIIDGHLFAAKVWRPIDSDAMDVASGIRAGKSLNQSVGVAPQPIAIVDRDADFPNDEKRCSAVASLTY